MYSMVSTVVNFKIGKELRQEVVQNSVQGPQNVPQRTLIHVA